MEGLDLTNASQEQLEKIKLILSEGQPVQGVRSNIREEYLAGLKGIKQSEESENMVYDTKGSFEDELKLMSRGNLGGDMAHRRATGRLNHDDKVTYKQLETIHESGTPENFWSKIRGVVESRRHVDVSSVDDNIDSELKLLK